MLVVNEIFHSIQGESTKAGMPCVFVRLTFCNLRCDYCDTTYAYTDGKEMTVDEVIKEIKKYKCSLVEITGGEPLLQSEVYLLTKNLCNENYEVLLETSGSVDISNVDNRVKRIVDFKCPSSMMEKRNLWENVNYLKSDDEVKFIIGDRNDYQWAKSVIEKYDLTARCTILMSVVFEKLEPSHLTKWILDDKLCVRFQLQMQKYIWHHETRGV